MHHRKLIIESQYFPCVAWMCAAIGHRTVWVDCAENYNKRSLRNKTWLHQSDQLLALSIPLKKGKHNGKGIKYVVISNEENWQLNHIRAIQSVYGKSPYFIHYFDDVVDLIQNNEKSLLYFTKNIFISVIELLKLEIDVEEQAEFIKSSSEKCVVLRDQFKYTGVLSKIESDIAFNINSEIDQTHLPFQLSPRSSILDLLFYLGPETRLFLKKIRPNELI